MECRIDITAKQTFKESLQNGQFEFILNLIGILFLLKNRFRHLLARTCMASLPEAFRVQIGEAGPPAGPRPAVSVRILSVGQLELGEQ